jgi:hypothetical protein
LLVRRALLTLSVALALLVVAVGLAVADSSGPIVDAPDDSSGSDPSQELLSASHGHRGNKLLVHEVQVERLDNNDFAPQLKINIDRDKREEYTVTFSERGPYVFNHRFKEVAPAEIEKVDKQTWVFTFGKRAIEAPKKYGWYVKTSSTDEAGETVHDRVPDAGYETHRLGR